MGTILLVDDDPIQNMLTTRLIQFNGVQNEILSYTDPLKALEYLRMNVGEFQCIFLDLNMPELNGWEFLDRCQDYLEIPVFILTSSLSIVDQNKAEEYHQVKEFISKPLSNEKVEYLKLNYFSKGADHH